MKKHSYPPGLILIHNEIGEIDRLLHQAEAETLRAAKILSREILNLFPDELPKKILQLNAIDEDAKEDEPLKATFLEVILMKAITDSQRRIRFSSGFVLVSNTELQNIGLSTTSENKGETGSKLASACAEITRVTGSFLLCNFVQWGLGEKYPDVVEFAANCNFLEKTIPIPELQD